MVLTFFPIGYARELEKDTGYFWPSALVESQGVYRGDHLCHTVNAGPCAGLRFPK